MNQFFLSLLSFGGNQGPTDTKSTLMSLLPIAAIIAIFYFLIMRPQRKQQKETQRMLSALKKGDKVVTIGGIHGVVQSVRDAAVVVKVDENTKIEFTRSAIATVEAAKAKDEGEKPESSGEGEK